jgi:outer membrane lipoprotein carrier protein
MKKYIFLLPFATSLLAFTTNIQTFSADFTQTIVNDNNTTIKYSGNLIAKAPDKAKWSYLKPIKKYVYVNGGKMVIVEPELEQAIITRIGDTLAFFKVLQNAKKVAPQHYVSSYDKVKLNLYIKNKMIDSITYKDQLQNNVVIRFSHQLENKEIENSTFRPVIPKDFDIVTQ